MRKSLATFMLLLMVLLPMTGLCEFAECEAFGLAVELPKGWKFADKSSEGYVVAFGRNNQNTMVVNRREERPKIWDREGLIERYSGLPGFEFVSYHASEDGAERPWMSFKSTAQSENGTKVWEFFYYYTLADGVTAACGISLIQEPDAAMQAWIAAVEENLLGEALAYEQGNS